MIDDLHWADASTLALLLELASAESIRVLVIATYRDNELAPGAPLTEALAALHRHPDVDRLTLTGLDPFELADLVAALAGHELTIDATMQQLLNGLRDETNGNPFFALEILRYLASTGDVLQNASGRWEPRAGLDLAELPESVREVVAARVAGVGRRRREHARDRGADRQRVRARAARPGAGHRRGRRARGAGAGRAGRARRVRRRRPLRVLPRADRELAGPGPRGPAPRHAAPPDRRGAGAARPRRAQRR